MSLDDGLAYREIAKHRQLSYEEVESIVCNYEVMGFTLLSKPPISIHHGTIFLCDRNKMLEIKKEDRVDWTPRGVGPMEGHIYKKLNGKARYQRLVRCKGGSGFRRIIQYFDKKVTDVGKAVEIAFFHYFDDEIFKHARNVVIDYSAYSKASRELGKCEMGDEGLVSDSRFHRLQSSVSPLCNSAREYYFTTWDEKKRKDVHEKFEEEEEEESEEDESNIILCNGCGAGNFIDKLRVPAQQGSLFCANCGEKNMINMGHNDEKGEIEDSSVLETGIFISFINHVDLNKML